MSLVIDASVALKWFFAENLHEAALRILDRESDLLAPELILAEVANALWKKAMRGEIQASDAEEIVTLLDPHFTPFFPTFSLLPRAQQIAFELRHPVYDCIYIACAEASEATLVTDDRRLLSVVGGTAFGSLISPLAGWSI